MQNSILMFLSLQIEQIDMTLQIAAAEAMSRTSLLTFLLTITISTTARLSAVSSILLVSQTSY